MKNPYEGACYAQIDMSGRGLVVFWNKNGRAISGISWPNEEAERQVKEAHLPLIDLSVDGVSLAFIFDYMRDKPNPEYGGYLSKYLYACVAAGATVREAWNNYE